MITSIVGTACVCVPYPFICLCTFKFGIQLIKILLVKIESQKRELHNYGIKPECVV